MPSFIAYNPAASRTNETVPTSVRSLSRMLTAADQLTEILRPLTETVNARLHQYLALPDDCPDRLREAMGYSVLAGGKRLRPALVLLACDACGGSMDGALPAACAIEMVHTYSLIHDDLPAMDDDDVRRGRPTCHRQFDEATAILAGDGLLTLAFEITARDLAPPEVAAGCCADLAAAAGAVGMVGGQMADLEAESLEVTAVSQLESIHRRKTGRLLCSALTMGARIAGAPPDRLRSLQKYGKNVGLAFQIADDLLDVIGDADKMGKELRKDAGHGKLTYPSLLGESKSRQRAEQLIADAIQEIQVFGERCRKLEAVARFVIERDR
jgi:geranylgeranyl diphosphate synthase, type II